MTLSELLEILGELPPAFDLAEAMVSTKNGCFDILDITTSDNEIYLHIIDTISYAEEDDWDERGR